MTTAIETSGAMPAMAALAADAASAPGEFLTFRLGAETYGIDILKVQEIRTYEAPTTIANAPSFIKGVINLRGVIVPVLDLRIKLELPEVSYGEFTVTLILNVAQRIIGAVVDTVCDVLSLEAGAIRPAPEFASSVFDARYIQGLATVGEQMLIVLDIEKLMTSAEMALMDIH